MAVTTRSKDIKQMVTRSSLSKKLFQEKRSEVLKATKTSKKSKQPKQLTQSTQPRQAKQAKQPKQPTQLRKPRKLRQPRKPREPMEPILMTMKLRSATKRREEADNSQPATQPKRAKTIRLNTSLSKRTTSASSSSAENTDICPALIVRTDFVPTPAEVKPVTIVPADFNPAPTEVKFPVAPVAEPEIEVELTLMQALNQQVRDLRQVREHKLALVHGLTTDISPSIDEITNNHLGEYISEMNRIYAYTEREETKLLNTLKSGLNRIMVAEEAEEPNAEEVEQSSSRKVE